MTKPRYLTKSRFKLGLECETKLFYTGKKDEYVDAMSDDAFLQGLAEGGYQVGELAQWQLCSNPASDAVTTLDYDQAIRETDLRLSAANATIAEAAFRTGDLFIRADIVRMTGNELALYEVKSKSWDSNVAFWTTKGPRRLQGAWEPYLMDIAFQTYVIRRAKPGLTVKPYLVLLNKEATTSVEGLNQMFPVTRSAAGRIQVTPKVLSRAALGTSILREIDVTEDVEKILNMTFDLDGTPTGFAGLVDRLANIYRTGRQSFCGVGSKCKGCQFRYPTDATTRTDARKAGLKSGHEDCWRKAVESAGQAYDPTQPTVLEIWQSRKVDEWIGQRRFYIQSLTSADFERGSYASRQLLQVEKVRNNESSPWIDKAELRATMRQWTFPLHFIDFETARLALPFQKGVAPYEQTAFQFSHHTIDANGTVVHAGEWIEDKPGRFPNFEFVRALKKQLEDDSGTIFRYAPHENIVLTEIRDQLRVSRESDKDELCRWINTIISYKPDGSKKKDDTIYGPRCMVDMKDVIQRLHYDPYTRGSNSLKAVLPAIIQSSTDLRSRYGQPIDRIPLTSRNYNGEWVWIQPAAGNDPYKILPPIFADAAEQAAARYADEMEDVSNGGTATLAYAKLQFTDMSPAERDAIRKALLRYCELDTLAMVMLYEYWKSVV